MPFSPIKHKVRHFCSDWGRRLSVESLAERMNARPEQEQFALVKATLSLLTPPPSEEFLVDLFIRTHNSAFPVIIPPPDFHHLKLPLLRKMYLTALSHCREYRPSARAARRVDLAGSLDKGQESTRLSSISAALLDLSGRPVLDAEYRYILLARVRHKFP